MKKLLILIACLFWYLHCLTPHTNADKLKSDIQVYEYQLKCKALFEEVIQHIKDVEGLRLTVYTCPAGFKTIGYGHMLKKGENMTSISLEQADSILISDFNKRLRKTNEKLDYNKRLAIAHFMFNLGEGNYNKSKLKQRVETGQDISIILNYCHYRNNGKLIKSKHLYQSRMFEYNLYNLTNFT